jgi:hypothetical protein
MDRTKPVKFFKGLEIEATNHFLLPTMIAPGQYSYDECTEMLNTHAECSHILLGYMYDPAGNPLDIDLDKAFDLANKLMGEGTRVTLEIRPDQLTDEFVARCPDPQGPFGKLFVILIGTRFPRMDKIGAYTTLKLHSDYGNTENGGVWCVKAEDFKTAGTFTPWEAYVMDEWLK